MELFIRRRWTTKPAQSVSYSVFEGKHFLFQLRVFYFLSWITTGPVLVHLLLKFSMAYPILSMKAAISKIKLYSLLFGKISHHTQRGQTIHFECPQYELNGITISVPTKTIPITFSQNSNIYLNFWCPEISDVCFLIHYVYTYTISHVH